MTETQQTMTEFTYATGETDVIGDRFSPSVVLFWLKTSVAASNMRVMYKSPNTLLAAANLANAMSAQLDFVNQAGGRNSVKVSILEKDKLMQLAQNIQRLVFADVEGQRHQESMDMAQKQYTAQTNSVLIQQQMLDQQRKATADDNPSMPTE